MTTRGKWVDPRARKYMNYKDQVGWAAKSGLGWGMLEGQLNVVIHVFVKGAVVGDVDNYAKSILDGCNGVVWGDDRQVVELHVYRHQGTPERAEVAVSEMEVAG